METKKLRFDEAIPIFEDTFWTGFFDSGSGLHCNPYILVDDDDVVLFDPGSIPHYPDIMSKVIEVVDLSRITAIVLHHQDPDVCGNCAIVEDSINRPDLKIVTHSNNKRLVEHLGIKSDFYLVDENDNKLTLKSGRVLEFKGSPFLHSPFAIVTYDTKNKALFSSDIFGSILDEWTLFAEGDYLSAMARWHELIIPSSDILRPFLKRLQEWDIEAILPQHGSVITGERVREAFDYLSKLKCGLDVIADGDGQG